MAHNIKRRIASNSQETVVLTSDVEAFGRRLYNELERRGWSQSELARRAFPNEKKKVDNRGYDVTPKRDIISSWVRGKAVPNPQNLQAICKALNIEPSDLAPDITARTVANEIPSLAIQMAQDQPGQCFLRVNRLVPLNVALEVAGVLEKFDRSSNK